MLFSGSDSPKNCPFPWGTSVPSNTWFLAPTRVSLQTASRSIQQFMRSTSVWPTHRRMLHATSVATGHVCAMHTMWSNNACVHGAIIMAVAKVGVFSGLCDECRLSARQVPILGPLRPSQLTYDTSLPVGHYCLQSPLPFLLLFC